jgi:hypothetical protein
MYRERVYNDKIKYWKVCAGQFSGSGTAPPSSLGSPGASLKSHRLSDDSGVDVRSLTSSGRESRQSTHTTTSTSSDETRAEFGYEIIGQKVQYQRPSAANRLETIDEAMQVDISDDDLAGHTIINGYTPRDGELNIAVNLIRYITDEYIQLEEKDATGHTLLHTAATRALPLVVLALLKQGANPNSINNQGHRIWFSTALELDRVEGELSRGSEPHLHHRRGRLVDCLDLLERSPGFEMRRFLVPSKLDSPGAKGDIFSHIQTHHQRVGYMQAAAASFRKAAWPW